jgi:hypothetical protein
MVILQPHALKRRMLPGIAVRPGHRIRIFPVQQGSDCGVHNWYPAEAAMIAIAFHHRLLRCRRRHPGNRASVLCKVWWTITGMEMNPCRTRQPAPQPASVYCHTTGLFASAKQRSAVFRSPARCASTPLESSLATSKISGMGCMRLRRRERVIRQLCDGRRRVARYDVELWSRGLAPLRPCGP